MVPKWTLEEYLHVVRMERQKHLLVEGGSDRDVFGKLLSDHWGQTGLHRVIIDTAERLQGRGFEETFENREKVEWVCSSIESMPFAMNLVGFVDREFRGFGFEPEVVDEISEHRVTGRLVWSRGHSIENYFFEPDVLWNSLWETEEPHPDLDRLTRFASFIPAMLRQACAVGLTGRECHQLRCVRSTIDHTIFEVHATSVQVSPKLWRQNLEKRRLSPDLVNRLITQFVSWERRLESAEDSVIRWLCDGHIGLQVMWSAYEAYLLQAQSGSRLGQVKPEKRFRACASNWCHRTPVGRHDGFPFEVFALLELIRDE